ncbi:hypothetical protein BDR03DRAFT_971464 [Suillus americanus]|nr:hypothetical protein BDR03DRAFT_971464 [Suillus americanus]
MARTSKQRALSLQVYLITSRESCLSFVWQFLGAVCIAVSSVSASADDSACPMLCDSFIDYCPEYECLSIYIPNSEQVINVCQIVEYEQLAL